MKRFALVGIMVFAVFLLAGTVQAGGHDMPMMKGGMSMGMMGPMMEDSNHPLMMNLSGLGLDEKQMSEVTGIRNAFLKEVIRKRAEMQIAEIDLRDLLGKDPIDMKAVEATLKKVEALRAEIRLSGIRALEAVKTNLTADQRKKLLDSMEKDSPAGMGCGMMMKHGEKSPAGKTAPMEQSGEEGGGHDH